MIWSMIKPMQTRSWRQRRWKKRKMHPTVLRLNSSCSSPANTWCATTVSSCSLASSKLTNALHAPKRLPLTMLWRHQFFKEPQRFKKKMLRHGLVNSLPSDLKVATVNCYCRRLRLGIWAKMSLLRIAWTTCTSLRSSRNYFRWLSAASLTFSNGGSARDKAPNLKVSAWHR